MLMLSSLNRLRRYIGCEDNVQNNRTLMNFLTATSKNIEGFINRDLKLELRTQYFDVDAIRINYYPKAYPISSITSVYSDTTGLYDGSESEEVDWYIGSDSKSIVLDTPVVKGPKGLRVIYTGGIAAHGVQSTLALTSMSGTFTAGNFVTGSSSGAIGIIVTTATATPLVVETLMGVWEVGDVLTSQSSEGSSTNLPGVGGTVSAITAQSLAEANPEINMACEMQVRFDWKHKDDFENAGVNKDSTTFRRKEKALYLSGAYKLQPEVRSILQAHRNIQV